MNSPVVVVSFDRPHYLEQVLDSVAPQIGARKIALFQDGTLIEGKGHKTDPTLAEKCVDIFTERFPKGDVFASKHNLGTALNIDRAERYVFETLGSETGIFLEDDLVLGPVYFEVLEKLLTLALADERIGYVAAFGDWRKSREQQLSLARRLRPLHLLWGFGLTKRHWLKCRPYVNQYLELVRGVEYGQRDHKKIRELTASWGVKPGDTAQDRIKSFVTAMVGATKLNTEVAYGKYIGESGMNFNPKNFAEWGFGKTDFFSDVQSLDFDLQSINFDPWFSGNNIWKLDHKDIPKEKGVPLFDFNSLSNLLFGQDPYDGFQPIFKEPEFQNWNSTHRALTLLVKQYKPRVIADVGVWKGMSAYTLATAQRSVRTDGYLIAIDTFLGSPEHWTRDRPDVHASLRFKNGRPNLYDIFMSNMVLTGMQGRVFPLVQTSDNAASIMRKNNIRPDLVHIDAAHEYNAALHDIENYYDLLNKGGVMIGDDWNWFSVAKAVVHFADKTGLKVEIDHPKWWIQKPA